MANARRRPRPTSAAIIRAIASSATNASVIAASTPPIRIDARVNAKNATRPMRSRSVNFNIAIPRCGLQSGNAGNHRDRVMDGPSSNGRSRSPVHFVVRRVLSIVRSDIACSAWSRATSPAKVPPESASNCSRTACSSSRIGCFFVIQITQEFDGRTNQHLPQSLAFKYIVNARQFVSVCNMLAI